MQMNTLWVLEVQFFLFKHHEFGESSPKLQYYHVQHYG